MSDQETTELVETLKSINAKEREAWWELQRVKAREPHWSESIDHAGEAWSEAVMVARKGFYDLAPNIIAALERP